MPQTYINTTFSESFFKPLFDYFPGSKSQYVCHDISDLDFLQLGLHRCVSQSKSGHDFVQQLGDDDLFKLTVSAFFKALKSRRRLANLTSVNDLLAVPLKQNIHDPFAQFSELSNWEVYAVDGHYQKAACHDPIHINRKGEASHAPTGHFFRLNLRNHHMSVLDTMQPDRMMGRKVEHDARVIKRTSPDDLRYNAAQGKRVMLAWDRACIDFKAWHTLKHQHATYFVTIEKSNSAAIKCSGDLCDHSDPVNEGIISEENIGLAGELMRRIHYKNPMDGQEYKFLTNDMSLPAYLIVTFYKQRWDIEKAFYEFKSKFQEQKSWATSYEAKKAQATFQCLLHNMLLLMEKKIESEEGLHDEVSEKIAKGRKRKPHIGFINNIVQRATQRTFRFIRWLRNHLANKASLAQAIARLYTLYTQPL